MNRQLKKLANSIRAALINNGTLQITWDCGGDDTILDFQGWGESHFRDSHPHHEILTNLSNHIVDVLELPNAGGVSDQGHGKVFIDSADDKIKLLYSSACVDYESADTPPEFTEFAFQNGEFELEHLDAPDFQCVYWLSCRMDSPELWQEKSELRKQFLPSRCDPNVADEYKTILSEALWPIIEPLADSMLSGKKHVDFVNEFQATIKWTWASKTVGYNIEPSFGSLYRLSQEATEELF